MQSHLQSRLAVPNRCDALASLTPPWTRSTRSSRGRRRSGARWRRSSPRARPWPVSSVTFDTDLYGGGGSDPNRFAGYDTSIPASEDDAAEDDADAPNPAPRRLASYTGHAIAAADLPRAPDDDGLPKRTQRIIDREDDYRRRRLNQIISPERHDPFAAGEATPDPSVRTYADVMRDAALKKKKEDLLREIAKKKKEEEEEKERVKKAAPEQPAATTKRRNRWDQSQDGDAAAAAKKSKTSSDWDAPDATPGIGRWDATPGRVGDATPSVRRNRWDETPTPGRMADADATPAAGGVTPGATPSGAWDATPKLPGGLVTPTPKKQRSRWDETPASMGSATPGGLGAATPAGYTPGPTPFGAENLATPTPSQIRSWPDHSRAVQSHAVGAGH
ncbi:hypothetical protein PR202_gb05264 [Eleusine coracana subsp. coracana]|uniref:Splicing factor 3B subunit 1 domain-containing protein n=1 Tax=Eleusine coracana subsp. coracana TaxID=191504 RepID=A0AAV5E7G8_ELECO|nr:hypothetical protein PR202_gb05264 [Eleusine coracana subsp. coracana]